ncbi:MAG: hypothetical protein PSV35_00315, partial [bacterium]|nr:hypothetical protein [bacterium]
GYGFSGASSSAPSGPWNDNYSAFDYGGTDASGSGSGGYKDWAGVYAFFFSILIYTSMYLVIVQKAFTLISYLPDKVLRWIGGSPESLGQESSQWGDEVKQKSGEAAKGTQDAQGQISKQLGGIGQKQMNDMKSKGGGEGDVSAEASKPPDDPGGGGGGAAAGGGEGVAGLAAEGAAAG